MMDVGSAACKVSTGLKCAQSSVALLSPMILAAVFLPKFKKSAKRGLSREMTYFFVSQAPKQGRGGVLLPGFCPKISKTLKFGLFWGISACSGLVLQNSAAHQCTCLQRIFDRIALSLGFSGPNVRMGGIFPPELSPKPSKTLDLGLFWSTFVCCGVVLQNSAAHQRTCILEYRHKNTMKRGLYPKRPKETFFL